MILFREHGGLIFQGTDGLPMAAMTRKHQKTEFIIVFKADTGIIK